MRPDGEKTTVLVADDEPDVREYVRTVLLRNGYEVLEAKDGLEAYELVQRLSGGIQLLVVDVEMPGMDGLTLGQKLEVEHPAIKVLYTTGFIWKPSEHSPGLRFLSKPFLPDVLIRCVQDLCAG